MKHLIRLLIALIIGVIAAVLNWMWMSRERAYPEYVYVSEPIAAGEPITRDKLMPVGVKGDAEVLAKILVPWNQKELWYDRFAPHDYFASQPLFQRDMVESSTTRDWDVLGPFTLVGVGNEPTSAFSGEPGQLIPVSGNILTLAIDDSRREEKGLLYRYLAAMRGEYYFNETAAERNLLKIIGVEPRVSARQRTSAPAPGQLESSGDGSPGDGSPGGGMVPQMETASPDEFAAHFAGQRLIFVSLENVPNAPTWLRIGEEIYFMVPPGKQTLMTNTVSH